MKRFLLGLLLFLLGTGAGYLLFRGSVPHRPDMLHAQTVASVTRRDISSSVLATGIIKPMIGSEVRVGSRISGIVDRLHVNVGDSVGKGQLLAELDATELQARRDQSVAAVEMARAELDFANLELRRQQGLFAEEIISQEEFEAAAKSQRLAELRVREAEANLAHARIQLDYSRILAPISGVVASVTTQEGETVAASFSTPTFVTIIDLNRLELWAYVDETDIGRVSERQRAVFTVDTYPEAEFTGEVVSIQPNAVIQNTVVNYIAIIRIGRLEGKVLRPEMTANVTIFLETREDVLAVPRQAVRRDRGRYQVLVFDGQRAQPREVQVGWRDEAYTEIIAGLAEGESVVVGVP